MCLFNIKTFNDIINQFPIEICRNIKDFGENFTVMSVISKNLFCEFLRSVMEQVICHFTQF